MAHLEIYIAGKVSILKFLNKLDIMVTNTKYRSYTGLLRNKIHLLRNSPKR